MTESNAIMLVGFVIAIIGIVFAVCVVQVIAMWKIFVKAGLPGWNCLVPIYGVFKQSEFTWGNGWLFLLLCIPFGGIVFQIATCFKLAKVFGKGTAFGFGLLFLPIIFCCILGFGKAEYTAPDSSGKKGCIIAASVLGALYILFVIICGVLGIHTAFFNSSVGYQFKGMDRVETVEKDSGNDENVDSLPEVNDELLDVDKYQYLKPFQLTNGTETIQVYGLADSTEYGNTVYGEMEGISLRVEMEEDNLGREDLREELVENTIADRKELLEELDFYTDITLDAPLSGDGWYMRQMDYTYLLSGEEYPCIMIVKADGYSDRSAVVFEIEMDGFEFDADARKIADEVFQATGIVFSFE